MTCFLQLSFDTLRDEELPLSQEYAPPVRTGQPEMREPIIYHQLTKEAVKKQRKLISVPAYEVPDKRAPAANQAPVQEAPSVKQAPAHGAPVNPNPADGRKIIQMADMVKQVKKSQLFIQNFVILYSQFDIHAGLYLSCLYWWTFYHGSFVSHLPHLVIPIIFHFDHEIALFILHLCFWNPKICKV